MLEALVEILYGIFLLYILCYIISELGYGYLIYKYLKCVCGGGALHKYYTI